jgi:hypothetical protein
MAMSVLTAQMLIPQDTAVVLVPRRVMLELPHIRRVVTAALN